MSRLTRKPVCGSYSSNDDCDVSAQHTNAVEHHATIISDVEKKYRRDVIAVLTNRRCCGFAVQLLWLCTIAATRCRAAAARAAAAAVLQATLVLAHDVIEVAVARHALLDVGKVAVGARRRERCRHVRRFGRA